MSLEGTYKNVGHAGSPIKWAHFVEDGGSVVRAYSFLSDDRANVVVLHESERLGAGEVDIAEGWIEDSRDEDYPKVTILHVKRP